MTVQPTRDQLRALADKATPGPWEAEEANGGVFHVAVHPYPEGSVALDAEQADAEFIAAARTALPQLLDQLDAAEQRIRDLTQEVRDERAACLDQMEQVQIRDARIKAVRELHHHDVFRGHLDNGCAICGHDWPCETLQALEG